MAVTSAPVSSLNFKSRPLTPILVNHAEVPWDVVLAVSRNAVSSLVEVVISAACLLKHWEL